MAGAAPTPGGSSPDAPDHGSVELEPPGVAGAVRVARTTVQELLDRARARLDRVAPRDLDALLADVDTVVVDIRSDEQRAQDGPLPGSVRIARNVLEWRADPASPDRDPAISDPARRIVLVCHEGYQSSLAAATLQELGLPRATDLDGGFVAWRASGAVSGS